MSDDSVIDQLLEVMRAEGYAQGVAEGVRKQQVRLRLMADELRMMPEALVDAYGALCVEALKDGTEGGRGEDVRVPPRGRPWRTTTGQTETRGLAKASSKKGPRGGPSVKSTRLLALKSSVDRKLRKIAREIERDMMRVAKEPPRKCTRCGKYAEDTWNWCPFDGAPTVSEDPHAQ